MQVRRNLSCEAASSPEGHVVLQAPVRRSPCVLGCARLGSAKRVMKSTLALKQPASRFKTLVFLLQSGSGVLAAAQVPHNILYYNIT